MSNAASTNSGKGKMNVPDQSPYSATNQFQNFNLPNTTANTVKPFSFMNLLTAEDNEEDDGYLVVMETETNVLGESVDSMLERQRHSLHRAEFQNEYLEKEAERCQEEVERLFAEKKRLERETKALTSTLNRVSRGTVATHQGLGLDCKLCEMQIATVMMWPCRHVSVCELCNDVISACPVCWQPKRNAAVVLSNGN